MVSLILLKKLLYMLMAIVMSKAELKRKNKRLKLWYKNMKLQFLNKDLDYILTMKEKDNFWEIEERKDEAGLGNPKRTVCVIGHKNPDTDSICSAIAYADIKNRTTKGTYVAKRAGQINEETEFVLKYFHKTDYYAITIHTKGNPRFHAA